jgi:hypothetical protein
MYDFIKPKSNSLPSLNAKKSSSSSINNLRKFSSDNQLNINYKIINDSIERLSFVNTKSKKNVLFKFDHDEEKHLIQQPERIIINSRGIKYDVILKIFDKLPESRLGSLKLFLDSYKEYQLGENPDLDEPDLNNLLDICDGYDLELNEFYFNKDPYVLNSILNFYTNDKLHIDDHSCAMQLADEFRYWDIDEEILMDRCCEIRYYERKDAIQSEVKKENQELNKSISNNKEAFGESCFPDVREKVWNLFEKPTSSIYARVDLLFTSFFIINNNIFVHFLKAIQIISTILVILPAIIYVLSTLPDFDPRIIYLNPSNSSNSNQTWPFNFVSKS